MATIGGAGAPNALATVAAMSMAEQGSLMMRTTLALVTGPLLAAAMLCAAIPAAAQSPPPGAAAPASSAASEPRKLNLSGKVWKGDLDQMIWKVPEMISYLSGLFTLQPGDLIFSGTPAGVGGVQRGDRIEAGVDGVAKLSVKVV